MSREEKYYTLVKDTIDCIHKRSCDYYTSSTCTCSCNKLIQSNYMLKLSNLPTKFQKPQEQPIPINTYGTNIIDRQLIGSIVDNIDLYVNSYNNLYIFGDNGFGKTTVGMQLLFSYIKSIGGNNNFTCRGIYISVTNLLVSYKLNALSFNPELMELLHDIRNASLVVFDNLYVTQLNANELQLLFDIIDYRQLNDRSNIFINDDDPDTFKTKCELLYNKCCKYADKVNIGAYNHLKDNSFSVLYRDEIKSRYDDNGYEIENNLID